MFARRFGPLESLRTGKGIKENMISKQKREVQIIITQVQFGEGVSGKGAFLKPLNLNVRENRISWEHFNQF